MKPEKQIGSTLIAGVFGVLVPYSMLTIIFEYPDILRQDTAIILQKFEAGGSTLIGTWFAFAILGLPLIVAYTRIGQLLENNFPQVRWITTVGLVGLLAQMIGLLRWTFVVPVLAENYRDGNAATQAASEVAFQMIHQAGGVLLGEYIGQLFTIIWTVGINVILSKSKFLPGWMAGLGYCASVIYFLAQAELFATVIPGFPVWDWAGFVGSTLWLLWLFLLGINFFRSRTLSF